MNKIEELRKECERLSAKYGDTFSIPVIENKRLRTTLGLCRSEYNSNLGYYTPTEIQIASEVLKKDFALDVIRHEWCHYYLSKTDPNVKHGHDKVFKALCKEVGCDGSMHKKSEDDEKIIHKYTVYCPRCGEIAGYDRMCKTLKYIDCAEHTKCGTIGLSYIQNW